jgi:hypothetical protein
MIFTVILKILEILGQAQTDWAKKKKIEVDLMTLEELKKEETKLLTTTSATTAQVIDIDNRLNEIRYQRRDVYDEALAKARDYGDAELLDKLEHLSR